MNSPKRWQMSAMRGSDSGRFALTQFALRATFGAENAILRREEISLSSGDVLDWLNFDKSQLERIFGQS